MDLVPMYEDVPDDKLKLRQIVELERSDDPADVERVKRLTNKAFGPLKDLNRNPMAGLMKDLESFQDQMAGERDAIRNLQDSWQRQRDEMDNSMRRVQVAARKRDEHKYEAEQAAIDNRELLDALVNLAQSQQAQLVVVGEFLGKVAEATSSLHSHALAESVEDGGRWSKAWSAQKWEIRIAIVGALLAAGAIWSAFAAAKPSRAPIVNVPAPVVTVDLPSTTSTGLGAG